MHGKQNVPANNGDTERNRIVPPYFTKNIKLGVLFYEKLPNRVFLSSYLTKISLALERVRGFLFLYGLINNLTLYEITHNLRNMKVIVIFDEVPEKSSWFEADASWLKFNGVYINRLPEDDYDAKSQNELADLVFDKTTGEQIIKMNDFDLPITFLEPVTIVRCGFLL